MENFRELIRLTPGDNVLIACRNLNSNQEIEYDGQIYRLKETIGIGHKIASCDIKKGQDVIKFNVCIGVAKTEIKKGEHVHVHNIKSKFILTHLRESKR